MNWYENACLINEKLTNYLHETDLVDDRYHVHLTHVVTSVCGLNVLDVESPSSGVVLGHAEPWDERDATLVDGEQHLAVQVHPRHLWVRWVDGQVS